MRQLLICGFNALAMVIEIFAGSCDTGSDQGAPFFDGLDSWLSLLSLS